MTHEWRVFTGALLAGAAIGMIPAEWVFHARAAYDMAAMAVAGTAILWNTWSIRLSRRGR